MRVKCLSCNGIYETEQGGSFYRHVCPPEFNQATKKYQKRKDHRDENYIIDDSGKKSIKSKGKGIEKLND